jgi:hypothetical protein
LRLGNYLSETKPLKFLHKREGGQAASADADTEPLVLKLGNYLNGASVPKPGDAPAAGAPETDHAISDDAAAEVLVDASMAEPAQEKDHLPAANSGSAPAAAVPEEPSASTVVAATG